MKLAMRPALGDALLEDLAVLGLGVRQQQVVVDGLVPLALRGVDLQLAEQRVHAEGAGLVGDDRHHPGADALVAAQVPQQAREGHGGADRLVARPRSTSVKAVSAGSSSGRLVAHDPAGDRAVEGAAPLHHVLVLDRVGRRPVVRRLVAVEGLVGDLVVQVQTVAQHLELLARHLLDLVGGVAPLDLRARASSP